jgi:SAM-dependent methyltransferase
MIACPDCGTTYSPADFRCPRCGFSPSTKAGFVAWAPELSDDGGGFEAEYFAELAPLEARSFWFRSRNALITRMIKKYFPAMTSFMEVGCGTGFVLSGVRQAFPAAKMVGTEIFTAGLHFAAARLPDVTLMQMDARRVPFVSEFDVAGAFDVIEHIAEDVVVLRNLAAAVKPGGGVIITVPQHPRLWSPADDLGHHVRRYTAADLHSKIEGAGLRILYTTSFVSLLLPVMAASRLFARWRAKSYVATTELSSGNLLNACLMAAMNVELAVLRLGITFPMGGSRLVVAQRPGA